MSQNNWIIINVAVGKSNITFKFAELARGHRVLYLLCLTNIVI
jgi:hypothetical protein